MRMLGEMAVANPTVGSFVEYCRSALGGWAGFSVGWLYWYFWVIVARRRGVAGATILQRWIDLPVWLMSFVLMALLTATNLWSVKSFGEFEFWFASIKVVAIIAFIAIARGLLFGIGGGDSPGLSNLTAHDGFFPAGPVTVLSGVVIVIFAFVGAEIVTIAAAESDEPERAVAQAVNSVVARVFVFYVLSIFLVVCDRAVERRQARRLAVHRRTRDHRDPGRRRRDERDRRHRRPVVPELGDLHGVADAVRARPARRRAEGAARGQRAAACRSRRSCCRSRSASCR